MQKLFLLFSFLANAFAFVPQTTRTTTSSLKMAAGDSTMSKSVPFLVKPKNLDGLVGSEEFDPFGFAETFDIKFLREAELKHARIAMLATVGWLVQSAGIHLPSPNGLYDVSNPLDAFFHVGPSVYGQIFLFIGALESINHNGKLSMYDMFTGKDAGREPGMFTLPIYGASQLKGKTQAQIDDLKLKELRNGRLAMFAIGGCVHHTIIGGTETLGAFPNPDLWGL